MIYEPSYVRGFRFGSGDEFVYGSPSVSPELARLEALVDRSAREPVTADEYCAALRAYLETVRPLR